MTLPTNLYYLRTTVVQTTLPVTLYQMSQPKQMQDKPHKYQSIPSTLLTKRSPENSLFISQTEKTEFWFKTRLKSKVFSFSNLSLSREVDFFFPLNMNN